MSLFSPDSDLSVPNRCWRYLEVSSYLPDKVWRGFGCTLDVFRSIWSQENRLFECQKLRKSPIFSNFVRYSQNLRKTRGEPSPPDSDLSVQNGLWRYLEVFSFQALQRKWADTPRYLQHRFGMLRSLSAKQSVIACFSKICTVCQKIRPIKRDFSPTFGTRKVHFPGSKSIWKHPAYIQNISRLYKAD